MTVTHLKKKASLLAFLLSSALAFPPVAHGGGFPGQGDPAGWSQALPYYNRGNRYLNQGRYQDAINDYRQAIDLYQFDPDFYTNLGVAYRKVEDYAQAEQVLKVATELNPNDWVAWSDLANCSLKQNKLKETITIFQRTLKCKNLPAAERANIQTDIADITKILRQTGQLPDEKSAGKTTESAGHLSTQALAKGAAKTSSRSVNSAAKSNARQTGSVAQRNAEPSSNPGIKANGQTGDLTKDPKLMHDSGWDWTSK